MIVLPEVQVDEQLSLASTGVTRLPETPRFADNQSDGNGS